MTLTPLLSASPVIQAHAMAALAALALAGHQFLARPGTVVHRTIGYAWVVLMGMTALSSFFIHDLRMVGSFSVIHLLSILVLVMLVRAVTAARAGNVTAHRKTMQGMVVWGLFGAGLFTLLPGRIMHAVVFG
jgi:uncharacterized membrane protein